MSITFFVLAMIGIIILFIGLCIYNEGKIKKQPRDCACKAKPELTQVEKETNAFIEQLERLKKIQNEEGQRKQEELVQAIRTHNEIEEAVRFTQELINQGL